MPLWVEKPPEGATEKCQFPVNPNYLQLVVRVLVAVGAACHPGVVEIPAVLRVLLAVPDHYSRVTLGTSVAFASTMFGNSHSTRAIWLGQSRIKLPGAGWRSRPTVAYWVIMVCMSARICLSMGWLGSAGTWMSCEVTSPLESVSLNDSLSSI